MRALPLVLLLGILQTVVCIIENPRTNPEACNREGVASSFICDPDGILSRDAADRIDLIARQVSSAGPIVAVAVLEISDPNVPPHHETIFNCRPPGRRAANAIMASWRCDALILYTKADREFCVVSHGHRVPLSAMDVQDIFIGAHDPLVLGIPEHAISFALLSMKDAAVLPDGDVLPPTGKELFQVAVSGMIPFLGFGATDNTLMIICGEAIENFLGGRLGMSTMAAAAWGNLLSDVAGVFLGGTVQQFAFRVGAVEPVLTHAQKALPRTVQCKLIGEAFGVGFGCWVGMVPLLFYGYRRQEDREPSAARQPEIRRDISKYGFNA